MYTVSPATSSHVDYAGGGLEAGQTAVPRRASTAAGRQLIRVTQRYEDHFTVIRWLALNGMNSTAIDHHPTQPHRA